MIIECKNCSTKFVVNNNAISANGRTVQCSNCSVQWLQLPISSTPDTIESEEVVAPSLEEKEIDTSTLEKEEKIKFSTKEAIKASDGITYKFMGKQWAQLLSSGKTGKLARKKIALELNKKTGISKKKQHKKKIETTQGKETNEIYTEKEKEKGMGIFSFLIVLTMFFASIILFLDTFKNQIIPFWPELDNYLIYIFETLNNIFIIIKDLFNNYK